MATTTRTYKRIDTDADGVRTETVLPVVVDHCNNRRGTETWIRYLAGDKANRDAFTALCKGARAKYLEGIKAWALPVADGAMLLQSLRDDGFTVDVAMMGMN